MATKRVTLDERLQNEKRYARRNHLRKYGLDTEQFDAILERQGGVCAICYSDVPGGHGAFHIDHDHVSDKNRGLLCVRCNLGLGSFSDDPEKLRRAADYLELPSLAVW